MKKNRVYITGYSAISVLGNGITETLNNIKNEEQYFTIDKDDKFPFPKFEIKRDFLYYSSNIPRNSIISIELIKNIKEKLLDFKNIPVFLATSTGGIRETELVYKKLKTNQINYQLFNNHFFNKTIIDIKNFFNELIGECITFSTACSSSGHSIIQAYNFIKNGLIDKAIVIGVDSISYTTLIGFDSLKLISHTGTKPLTKHRDGITIGEGGGILLLESNPENEILGEICGCFSNSDGYHISSPDPEGRSQRECILNAISQSGLNINDIEYISAHGTGTVMNDEVEMKTIESIFSSNVKISSLKAFIGHTLGASAIIEIAITLAMLKVGKIYQPKNYFDTMDNNKIPDKTFDINAKYFLKNSFGFGGNNTSIVIKK